VPPKVGEVIELLERDGRRLARTTGSHRARASSQAWPGRDHLFPRRDSVDVTMLDGAA
jgi:hypothetical protein